MMWNAKYASLNFFNVVLVNCICEYSCYLQVRTALSWLHGERVEYRRFAAVLILKVSLKYFFSQIKDLLFHPQPDFVA